MRRATFLACLVLLPGLRAAPPEKPAAAPPAQELTPHYERMLRYHLRMDGNVPARSVVFVGDSLVQGLFTDAVAQPSVNYGIGQDTTVGVLGRLLRYQAVQHAAVVVLAIGVNDLMFRDPQAIAQNYRLILQALPAGAGIVCSAVLPVNELLYRGPATITNARIRELNASLQAVCAEDARCIFVNARDRLADADGNLAAAWQDGDGIHLNSAGNRRWIETLREAVDQARH